MFIRYRCVLVMLIAGAFAVEAAEVGKTRVRIEGYSSADSKLLRTYVVDCDRLLRRYLGTSRSSATAVLAATRDDITKGAQYSVVLKRRPEFVNAATELMLERAISDSSDAFTDGDPPFWLLAGLRYLVVNGDADNPGDITFPTCRAINGASRTPSLERLLAAPVAPKSGLVYSVYSEVCALLIKALHQQDRRILYGYGATYNPEKDDFVALVAAVPPLLATDGKALQKWFVRRFRQLAAERPGELTLDEAAAGLRKLETVSMAVARGFGGTGIVRVNLEEADEVLSRFIANPAEMAELKGRFIAFQQTIPYSLRTSLDDYCTAFDHLRVGQTKAFSKKVKAARVRFAGELQRARELTVYLDRLEQERGDRLSPLAPYKALQNTAPERRALDKLLDRVERGE